MPLASSNTVSSPAANALKNKLSINQFPTTAPSAMANSTSSVGSQSPNPYFSPTLFGAAPKQPAPPAPTTPVKSTTVSHPDGTTVATTYHAPDSTGLVNPTTGKTNQQVLDDSTNAATTAANVLAASKSNPTGSTGAGSTGATGTTAAPTYQGLVGSLVSNANNTAAQGQMTPEELAARQKLAGIPGVLGAADAQIESTPSENAVQMGREAVAGRNVEAQRQSLADQVAAYAAERGANVTADTAAGTQYGTAAGYAQPQLAGYNQQSFNPLTSTFGSGTGDNSGTGAMSQLPADAQTAVSSYAQQVQNGSMTRADAESRLSAYGQPGLNALNEALGTNFNTNASNASAGTTATGQQIKTAADSTNKALDTLSTSFASLNSLETGGIPATNNIAQWIGTNLGDKALTQYKTNLADARSQLIGVLNSSGGTPTGNENTANQYLPDNMTKAQFDQNVGSTEHPGIVRQLISQKVSSFTGSGQQTPNTPTASSTTSGGVIHTAYGTINPSL